MNWHNTDDQRTSLWTRLILVNVMNDSGVDEGGGCPGPQCEIWKFCSKNLVHKGVDFDVQNALKLTDKPLYFRPFSRGDTLGSPLNGRKKKREKEWRRRKKRKWLETLQFTFLATPLVNGGDNVLTRVCRFVCLSVCLSLLQHRRPEDFTLDEVGAHGGCEGCSPFPSRLIDGKPWF